MKPRRAYNRGEMPEGLNIADLLQSAGQNGSVGQGSNMMALALFLMALNKTDSSDSVTTEHFGDKEVRTVPRWVPQN